MLAITSDDIHVEDNGNLEEKFQEKERKRWEGDVTSHFSEVDEFDLSFS